MNNSDSVIKPFLTAKIFDLDNTNSLARLFLKSWEGTLSQEEKRELKQWLEISPENQQAYDRMRAHGLIQMQRFEKDNPDISENQFTDNDIQEEKKDWQRWKEIVLEINGATDCMTMDHWLELLAQFKKDDPDINQNPDTGVNGVQEEAPQPVKISALYSKTACWLLAAACVAACFFLIVNRHQPAADQVLRDFDNTDSMVVVKLAGGSRISPDTVKDYLLIDQGNYQLLIHNNEVRYLPLPGRPTRKIQTAFNDIRIPACKSFRIVLPDQSKVFLNAGSTVRLPVSGAGGSIRNLELTGEGYFEVQSVYKNKQKVPFIVKVKAPGGLEEEVTVTGTTFNINAYGDDSVIKNTLLEGTVKVASHGKAVWLSAGEELQVGKIFRHNMLTSDDITKTIAWKEGYFSFKDGAPLQLVTDVIGRWYGRHIEVEEGISESISIVDIPRSKSLEFVLHAVCMSINCKPKIEGDRVRLIKNR